MAQRPQRLTGLGTQGFMGAFVFARLGLERGKTLVAEKIEPAFQCGSRIAFAAPGPLAGQGRGAGQREVLFDGLLDPRHRRVPGQSQVIGI